MKTLAMTLWKKIARPTLHPMRIGRIMLPLLCLMVAAATSSALQFGDFIYTTDGAVVTITGYLGIGGAVVPKMIDGKFVTTVGDSAFEFCTSLTSITIPNSVRTIGDSAFYQCTSLTSVTLGNSVTRIKDWAFSSCTSLTRVTIPYSVTHVGDDAFSDCISLASVTLGNSVTNIGRYTFLFCGGLTDITIPDNVATIGYGAFGSCTGLISVTIGSSVTNIGERAFSKCDSLVTITAVSNNPSYSTSGGVLFDKSQTTLFQYPGGQAGNYTIPDGVISIGTRAFESCASLPRVTIPGSVTSIESLAFLSCVNLTEIYFFGNAPSLGVGVFQGTPTTVYHLFETEGWPVVPISWGVRPTALWQPDSDDDGIPDSWENLYFGSSTGANPETVCSNGINTVREAYIAGLNPNNPQSALRAAMLFNGQLLDWNTVSGRVYSVYWTTNLLSDFQCLESNIPWTQRSFTNSIAVPNGYYKINVQLVE